MPQVKNFNHGHTLNIFISLEDCEHTVNTAILDIVGSTTHKLFTFRPIKLTWSILIPILSLNPTQTSSTTVIDK